MVKKVLREERSQCQFFHPNLIRIGPTLNPDLQVKKLANNGLKYGFLFFFTDSVPTSQKIEVVCSMKKNF